MNALLAQPMSDASSIGEMPPAIVALLRDEASLSVAKQVLEDARRDTLTRAEQVRSRRPTLGFLAAKKDRDAYQAAVDAIEDQLASFDAFLTRVNTARDRLQPSIRAALVQYLSEVDPLYRQGLRAGRFHERWQRALTVIADRLKAFLRDVREARNAMIEDVKNARSRHSAGCTWRLGNARLAAVELERAIDELNQTVTEHAAAITGTPFSEIRLPTLEHWLCISPIDTISGRAPVDAEAHIARLLTDFTDFKEPSLGTIEAMFQASAGEHSNLAESRLRDCWGQWLAYAETHLVGDAELEPTVADIERRMNEAERARISAQYEGQPFRHER